MFPFSQCVYSGNIYRLLWSRIRGISTLCTCCCCSVLLKETWLLFCWSPGLKTGSVLNTGQGRTISEPGQLWLTSTFHPVSCDLTSPRISQAAPYGVPVYLATRCSMAYSAPPQISVGQSPRWPFCSCCLLWEFLAVIWTQKYGVVSYALIVDPSPSQHLHLTDSGGGGGWGGHQQSHSGNAQGQLWLCLLGC